MADEKFSREALRDPNHPDHARFLALVRQEAERQLEAERQQTATKTVVIKLTLECRADVPVEVLNWMAGNLGEHAESEFGTEYDPSFTDALYDKEPFVAVRAVKVTVEGA